MGSIRYTPIEMYERHWADDWHKFRREIPKVRRQLVSSPEQLSLFDDDSIKHLKPKKLKGKER